MPKNQPKWSTPERQGHLVSLFRRSRGFCVYGHERCQIPAHHYVVFIENLIYYWKADDREQRQAEHKAEQRRMHSLGERRYPLHGQFNAIGKDIFFNNQPQFYFLGLGISGLKFQPFAKIRLASSFVQLHVDIDNTLKMASKSQRRKAIRYGKALPEGVQSQINEKCNLAVKHYLEH